MKNYLKYFLLLGFFAACRNNTTPVSDEILPLYSSPVIVDLDTTKGFTINPITGDSIRPLINSYGDTVKTGISFSIKAALGDADKIAVPVLNKFIIQPQKKCCKQYSPGN